MSRENARFIFDHSYATTRRCIQAHLGLLSRIQHRRSPPCISPIPTMSMKHYRVFIGAPSSASLYCNEGDFEWETFTTKTSVLDVSVFEAASRRISRLYENVIFAEDDEDIGDASDGNLLDAEHGSRAAETFITWFPTQNRTRDASGSQVSSGVQKSTMEETQETASHEYSDTSSIGRFPHFSFNLHTLRLVKALVEMAKSSRTKGSLKVNVLMAVLEVEGPDAVTIRKGPHAGNQASILKMILGDGDGNILKLTAWRGVAEMWGIGMDIQLPIRRGDIVLFQSVSGLFLGCVESDQLQPYRYILWLGSLGRCATELHRFTLHAANSRDLLPYDAPDSAGWKIAARPPA